MFGEVLIEVGVVEVKLCVAGEVVLGWIEFIIEFY